MTSNSCLQNEEEITGTLEDHRIDSNTHSKLNWEHEENDTKVHHPSELLNGDDSSPPHCIKSEPEDSRYHFQLPPMKEEIHIEEHKPGCELMQTSSTGTGMFLSDSAQQNELQSSESKSEGEADKYNMHKCQKCPFETRNKIHLTIHYKCKHGKEGEVYKCQECPYETRIERNLATHAYKHAKIEVIVHKHKCKECSYSTKYKSVLTRHFKCIHAKEAEVYKCQECSFESRYKSELVRHFRCKHAKETVVFKCKECSYETRIQYNLTRHFQNKHAKEAEVFNCQECSYETKYKRALIQHYRLKHAGETEVFKCEACSYETKIKSNFTKHCRYKHAEEAEGYKCLAVPSPEVT